MVDKNFGDFQWDFSGFQVPQVVFQKDASLTVWGAALQGRSIRRT